jgi:para-nitrobenzyl esterase
MISLAFAAAMLAQPAPAPAHPAHHAPAAAPAAAARMSVETTKIGDLLANPAAKAAIETVIPGFSAHPQIGAAAPFTLKALQAMVPQHLSTAQLEAIEKALAALPAS